jgi:molybdate transport system substrate-binding protein
MAAPSTVSATALALCLLAGGAACGTADETVIVFAASSLTDAFDRIESDFEAANPGIDVVVSFGGSSSLVAQIADGAPADVLATANAEQMERAIANRSVVAAPEVFARTSLVIAVEPENPLGIAGLSDLADGPVVVLAAPEVPAGAYAQDVLDCAGVVVEPASFEPSVRSVATKVALGEADAGLVYRTDIDGRTVAVDLDPSCNVSAEYPIVAMTDDPGGARFVDFVAGPDGLAALSDVGFERP